MSINLLHSLDQENIERAKMVYLPHSNKSMKKAQDNGWKITNTTGAHICNGIEKLNEPKTLDFIRGYFFIISFLFVS